MQRNKKERLKNCRAHHFLSSLESSEERWEKVPSLCYSYSALAFKCYKVLMTFNAHGTPLFKKKMHTVLLQKNKKNAYGT